MLKAHLSKVENIWLPFKEQNLIRTITVSCCWTVLETLVFRFFFQFKTRAKLWNLKATFAWKSLQEGGCCWAEDALFSLELTRCDWWLDAGCIVYFSIFFAFHRCSRRGAAGSAQHHPHPVHPWYSCARSGGEAFFNVLHQIARPPDLNINPTIKYISSSEHDCGCCVPLLINTHSETVRYCCQPRASFPP